MTKDMTINTTQAVRTRLSVHTRLCGLMVPLLLSACGEVSVVVSGDDVSSAIPAQLDDAYVVSYEVIPELEDSASDETLIADFGDPVSQLESLRAPPDGQSGTLGEWTNAMPWPLLAIHATLLPDGRVLTYGADGANLRGRAFNVDRWSPDQGLGMGAHEFTPTGIDTNIFCSAQAVLGDGNVLLSGGDQQPAGANTPQKNDGVRDTTLYNTASHTLSNGVPMTYERWYPTLVTLGNGQIVALGGRAERTGPDGESIIPIIPELYSPGSGRWEELPGAASADYYQRSWWYPRAFVNRRGQIIMFNQNSRDIYAMSIQNGGSFTRVATMPAGVDVSPRTLPTAMFRPGKVFMLTRMGQVNIVDIDAGVPTTTRAADPSGKRFWSDATVLANGTIFLSGGARASQQLDQAVHFGEIWDPETDTWTRTRESIDRKARLYHSTAILLPDASVLLAGGGPPGPVVNQNADIFYPPYLFAADGSRAPRPEILDIGPLGYNSRFNVVTGNGTTIDKVALVRAGSVTHSFDMGQRYMELDFTQSGTVLDVAAPSVRNSAPPGLYLVFLIDDNGVPSVAATRMLR